MKYGIIILKTFIVLLFLMYAAANLGAAPDVVAQLRLYEGFKEIAAPAGVTTSYYLKPLAGEDIYLEVDATKEQASLKRVFSLKDIKLITQAGLVLGKDSPNSQFQVIVLNGRELQLRLATGEREKNRFKVEVLEIREKGSPARSLLESSIYLPEQKTTVLGFEDSEGKIYFLSFHRGEDVASGGNTIPLDFMKKPKLIKGVEPQYPSEALKAHIQGKVMIEAVTDTGGRVVEAVVIEGAPELSAAALDAVKQWQYEPFLIDGQPRRVRFTVIIIFNLEPGEEKTSNKPINLSSDQKPKRIKSVPLSYPPEALKAELEGIVVLEVVIDTKGFVQDVKIIEGHDLFKTAAMETVKQWQYEPYCVKNVPQPARFTVTITFKLTKK